MSSQSQSHTYEMQSGPFPPEFPGDGGKVLLLPSAAPARVLQISDDLSLANSRRLLLRRAGFPVMMKTRREFWAESEHLDCDVVVLCQTILPGEAYAIAMAVKAKKHAAPIVRFTNGEETLPSAFCCLLQAPASPDAFCGAVRHAIASC